MLMIEETGERVYRNSLYYLPNFFVNLKLFQKIKSILKKCRSWIKPMGVRPRKAQLCRSRYLLSVNV